MNKLKFSHDYEKLPLSWKGTQAVLFSKFRNEMGNYELNFEEGLLLVLYHLNSKTFFTTIRRFTPTKSEYYQSCEQETFELVYTGVEVR